MRGIILFWYVWYTETSRQKSTHVFTYLHTSRHKYANELLCMVSYVWYGMVWYGVWYGIVFDRVWYGMVWDGMAWHGMVRCGMVWYGVVWYGMVLYDIAFSNFFILLDLNPDPTFTHQCAFVSSKFFVVEI